jgi:hypothetical protein
MECQCQSSQFVIRRIESCARKHQMTMSADMNKFFPVCHEFVATVLGIACEKLKRDLTESERKKG